MPNTNVSDESNLSRPEALLANANSPWRITGAMTVYTVAELRQQLLRQYGQPEGLCLDLSGVDACDCAGLQLLCAVRKSMQTLGRRFQVLNPSPSIQNLAVEIGLSRAEFSGTSL